MSVGIHIYAPRPVKKAAVTTTCPDCGKRTRMLVFFYEWYGSDATCIRCGRNWQDGEWNALPFMPKSREKSIEAAKALFRRVKVDA